MSYNAPYRIAAEKKSWQEVINDIFFMTNINLLILQILSPDSLDITIFSKSKKEIHRKLFNVNQITIDVISEKLKTLCIRDLQLINRFVSKVNYFEKFCEGLNVVSLKVEGYMPDCMHILRADYIIITRKVYQKYLVDCLIIQYLLGKIQKLRFIDESAEKIKETYEYIKDIPNMKIICSTYSLTI